MMIIQLNGDPHQLADSESHTVKTLLEEKGFGKRPVLVELNGKALLPRKYGDISLKEGDVVELVQIVAGG